MKKTKIIATIGPASESYETLKELVKNGINVARLNMSHGSYEEHFERVKKVRQINEELNTGVAILLDTKGPEVRTGLFENGEIELKKGNDVILTNQEMIGNSKKIFINYKGIVNDLNVDDIVLLDDGYITLKVKEKLNEEELLCEILNDGKIKDRRGVNVPGITLNFDFISEKDRSDILWACENDFDFIAASFVRTRNDILEIKKIIKETGKDIKIIAKIESQDGCDNFDEILSECDGIMIARGDLGVEIKAEDVPRYQREFIKKCNEQEKIVITATQMLESMSKNPRPTRAEVSDVFNAVMEGTDAVMLSGETAAGMYPIEAVKMQGKIAQSAEKEFDYQKNTREVYKKLSNSIADIVAFSVTSAASKVENAKVIIAITNSGATARKIAKMKPKLPILAITHCQKVKRSLALAYGVEAIVTEKKDTVDEALDDAVNWAKKLNYVNKDDIVIISAGSIEGKGNTDLMKVRVVK